MDKIKLVDALAVMRSVDESGQPIPFKLQYLTYSEQKKTGGEWRSMEAVMNPGISDRKSREEAIRARYAEDDIIANPTEKQRRSPRHRENMTINVTDCATSQPVKLRPLFIMSINGIQVEL